MLCWHHLEFGLYQNHHRYSLQTSQYCTNKCANGCAKTASHWGQPPSQMVDAEHSNNASRKLKTAHQARAGEYVKVKTKVQKHIGVVQGHNQCPENLKMNNLKSFFLVRGRTPSPASWKLYLPTNDCENDVSPQSGCLQRIEEVGILSLVLRWLLNWCLSNQCHCLVRWHHLKNHSHYL